MLKIENLHATVDCKSTLPTSSVVTPGLTRGFASSWAVAGGRWNPDQARGDDEVLLDGGMEGLRQHNLPGISLERSGR